MRLRVRYAKLGKIRFTSHRDSARHWERALRRAGVRVVTSGGFSPRPKLAFGLALPTGGESIAEYLDVELVDRLDLADTAAVAVWAAAVSEALPIGSRVLAVSEATDRRSLQESVVACTWRFTVRETWRAAAAERIGALLAADHLLLERERKGVRSVDDVRAAVESLHVESSRVEGGFAACLATSGRGLRPSELVSLLVPEVPATESMGRLVRTEQWIEVDGQRRELLPLPAALAVDEALTV